MIDLNDTFLNQDSQNYMLDYSKQHFSAPKSVAPKVFGTNRVSIEHTPVVARGHLGGDKYNSLIR